MNPAHQPSLASSQALIDCSLCHVELVNNILDRIRIISNSADAT